MIKKCKYFFFVFVLLVSSVLWANDQFNEAFNSGVKFSAKLDKTANNAMLQAKSELSINDNPKETKYYSDTTEVQDTLKQKARLKVDESDVGRNIKQSFAERPNFKVDQELMSMKKAETICNEDIFCMDGNCMDHSYKPNDEFAKEVSNLSGVVDASKQFNDDNFLIFNGQSLECSQSMIGFYNCCDYKGWGVNWGLIKCGDKEKKLAHARKEGLAVKLGRYCAHKTLGICRAHHESYCVFQSKQARIIQEQGRRKQLHKGFGSAKHPNCQGISIEDMQQINFSQIDFSEFFSDLNKKTKVPNIPTEIERVTQRMQKKYQKAGIK